jgi:hypothetical protein
MKCCPQVDQPAAGLIQDLSRRRDARVRLTCFDNLRAIGQLNLYGH